MGSVNKEKGVEYVCRENGISPATFYNWKNKYGEIGTEELKRMRELEAEKLNLRCPKARTKVKRKVINPLPAGKINHRNRSD